MPRFAFIAAAILCLSQAARPVFAQPRLAVHPAKLELTGSGDRHRVLVTLTAPDGSVSDVTEQAHIVSEHPFIASVSHLGEGMARGTGSTKFSVRYKNLEATVPVTVTEAGKLQPPSFVNEVLPLMTRLGCNQGACHGKGAGQNGFRLSLRGYAPEWDHEWLTREFGSRRINAAVPEASLLLRKPTGQAPHEGGKLLGQGTREYHLLLDWIKAGTPGLGKDDVALQKLEVLPGNRTFKSGQKQQLVVRAQFSGAKWRDVTWLSKFDSNDDSVAIVNPRGVVEIVRPGETVIRATFQGQVALLTVTAPHQEPVKPELFAKRNNFIDDHVFAKLKALRIEPSDECNDEVFLRRAYLDTVGVMPTSTELRAFRADNRPDRRARVIDHLLERPEFVDFWTMHLDDLFQNRKESDHDVRGTKGVRSLHQWLREQVAKNRPWNELARDVLTVTGSTAEHPAVGYYIVTVGERRAHESAAVAAVAQTFLGTRIGCAQCHNHPLEKYTQDDYYHFAAYFSRLKLERKDPKIAPTRLLVTAQNPKENKNPVGVTQPRTGKFMKPQPLDRVATPVDPTDDPRAVLARWITDAKNEAFAGAMVNRLWAHFFNVGLVEPVDDLRESNPPSNPALWKALIAEFIKSKFDRKHMMRLMLNSRAYQLASATKPNNARDQRFYSHYYARRLGAEVLQDALTQATGVPEKFEGYPLGMRAVQVPDTAVKPPFFVAISRPPRDTACACERTKEVNLASALHLLNSDEVARRLSHPEGKVKKMLRSRMTDQEIIDELFLSILGRAATMEQLNLINNHMRKLNDRDQLFQDIVWALINTRDFLFNR